MKSRMNRRQRSDSCLARNWPPVAQPPKAGAPGRSSGLTTIEMLLVVALLGILAGLTVPRFGTRLVPYEEVQTTAQGVVGHLRLARRQAISARRDHRLLLSPATKPYTSYDIEELNGSWTSVRGPIAIPDSVICSGDREHRFTAMGSATATTSVTLSRNAISRTVGVLAATGRVWMEP